MPGLIIGGKEYEVPGVKIQNFKDNPKLALRVGKSDGGNDGKKRTRPVSLVVLHTTKGIPGGKDKRPQVIEPGLGPDTSAETRTTLYWSTDPTPSGAHIVVDHDGSVGCTADLLLVCAYHAGQSEVNDRSVGIEIYQGFRAELYEEQIEIVRKIVDFITAHFSIQRQIPDFYRNRPVPRLDELGGRDLVGVIGHRDCSDARGKGDPGDYVMEVLARNGYERFDFFSDADKTEWKKRQQLLSEKLGRPLTIDGIIGVETKAALRELGYQHGIWMLPPKADKGSGLLESMMENFFTLLFSASGGSRKKALEAIREWLSQQSDKEPS